MTDKMDNYRIVETLTENQISDLMNLYKNEFWCDKRTREDVVKMLVANDVTAVPAVMRYSSSN